MQDTRKEGPLARRRRAQAEAKARRSAFDHLGKNLVIVVALVAAGFFAAWLRFRSYLGDEGQLSDGARVFASSTDDPIRYAVWDAPRALSPAINTPARESRPALSPDGRFVVFAVGERGLNADLYIASILGDEIVDPLPIGALNTSSDELAPAFDDDALWFASDRPGGVAGLDLYRAPYADGQFGAAAPADDALNSAYDDSDPAPFANGGALAFSSRRGRGDADLYVATFDAARGVSDAAGDPRDRAAPEPGSESGHWTVAPIAAINTRADEVEPAFAADDRTLFFASNRAGGSGGFDLYASRSNEGAWLAPAPITGLNSDLDERGPAATADGFTLCFERGVGNGDLQRARSIELYRLPGRPMGWVEMTILASLLGLALLAWLAQRWPAIDVIYKCFLFSVVAHIFLLWWSGRLFIENGRGAGAGPGEDDGVIELRIPVTASAAGRGGTDAHGAGGADGRGGEAPAGPSRASFDVAGLAGKIGAPGEASFGLVAATQELAELEAPTRAAQPFAFGEEPGVGGRAGPRADVALAAPSESLERRAGRGAGLGLEPSVASSASAGRRGGGSSGPARIAQATAAETSSAVPPGPNGSALDVGEPASPAPAAVPGRAVIGVGAGGSQGASVAVGLAQPADAVVRLGNGAGSSISEGDAGVGVPGFGLEPSPDASVSRSGDGSGPVRIAGGSSGGADRSGGPGAGEAGNDHAPTPGGLGLAVRDAGASRGVPVRAAGASLLPGPGSGSGSASIPSVALGDHEPRASKIGAPGGPGGPGAGAGGEGGRGEGAGGDGARDDDWISGLLSGGETGSGGGGSAAGAPGSKHQQGPQRSMPGGGGVASIDASAPAPAAPLVVAASAPVDRAGGSAPRERKSWDHTPYQNRAGEEKARALELHGGSVETEQAVAKGLTYLARVQRPRGHWGRVEARDGKYGAVAIGKTGLALLAFLGAGHTQSSRTEHSDNAARALAFLVEEQDEASGHFGDSESYSHGIATYALGECYALTSDPALRKPLERAVAHILAHQSKRRDPRHLGGWSYYYPDERVFDRWPRTSITAWQVMALESARLSGLEIPAAAFADARAFLLAACDEEHGYVRYNHDPERLGSDYPTLPASTPAGLFALSLLGEDIASTPHDALLAFVSERAPSSYRYTTDDAFVERATGNLYFWYYGTLALFRAGGGAWQRWNEAMKTTLLPAQQTDGSWKPIDIYARYAKDSDDDRSYTTAMCVLSLEVYYRYYLPLLQVR